MRQAARVLTFALAVALIAYGMFQPVEQDSRWLLALWLAAPLLLVAARLSLPTQPRGISRSIQNLGLLVALGFVLLSIQLLRQQFVRADDIANTVHVDDATGQTTSNVRQVIQSLRVQRGKMRDTNGVLLVDTEIVDGKYAVRRYPLTQQFDPSAFSNVVGFFSDRFGPSGLEATYDSYLSGERDSYNRLRDSIMNRPQLGDDLQLTIDARLQAAAKNLLDARGIGSVVVLDPQTGAVRAMVS
ncbi:peptidoglycan glycosyltransferase, partial [Kouleothrix aurantiaca]